jgi:hypothetical protein
MSEHGDETSEDSETSGTTEKSGSTENRGAARPSLTTQVRRRRADQAFFIRLRDAMHQNHNALERIGT